MMIVASGLAAIFVLSASSVCVIGVTETTPLCGRPGALTGSRVADRAPTDVRRSLPGAGTTAIPSADASKTSSSGAPRRVDPADQHGGLYPGGRAGHQG